MAYAVNLVEKPESALPIQVYIHDPEGRQFQATLKQDQAATRIILDAWKSGKVLYPMAHQALGEEGLRELGARWAVLREVVVAIAR